MLLALDLHYEDDRTWVGYAHGDGEGNILGKGRYMVPGAPEPYVSGQFWRRELPPIMTILEAHPELLDNIRIIFVDCSCQIPTGPSMGEKLYDALGGKYRVIGVAKTLYLGSTSTAITRGTSKRPLYVSEAATNDFSSAAELVLGLAGPHRLPTILKMADLCAGNPVPGNIK
jgi:deoxyinosine 3'endonuclease (endonuclease V)